MIEAGWTRLRTFWRPSVRAEVHDELAFHLEMRTAELIAAGLSREEAARQARAMFGDVDDVSAGLVKIGTRQRRRFDLHETFDGFLLDLRLAVRFLRRHQGFALTAMLILALGIGASTAIFGVVNAVILRPLPYGAPEQLVVITQDSRRQGVSDDRLSVPDMADLRAGVPGLADVAAVRTVSNYPVSIDGGAPEPVVQAIVTPNFLELLGTPVIQGRGFRPDDAAPNRVVERPSDGPARRERLPVMLISSAYWQRRFKSDPSIVGREIVGPNGPIQIIGVTSPKSELLFPERFDTPRSPDVWYAIQPNPTVAPRFRAAPIAVGRMKRGVSVDELQTQIDSVAGDLDRRFPQRRELGLRFNVESMHEVLIGDAKPTIVTLMIAVGILVLISCANVGSLVLVRAAHRSREFAVRAAIGGSRWQVIRRLLAESALLAGVSCLLGLFLARAILRVLPHFAPSTIPRLEAIGVDGRVVLFATAVTAGAFALFGLVPALHASTAAGVDALRTGGGTPALGGRRRFTNVVVVTEVAFSFVLLVSCALMTRTFFTLAHADLGFDPNRLLTFTLSNINFADAKDRFAFVHQVRDSLANIPGVQAATLSTGLPLQTGSRLIPTGTWRSSNLGGGPSQSHQNQIRVVLPGFFEVMRTPVLRGRTFTAADDSTEEGRIIVDDIIARQAYGTIDVVGKALTLDVTGTPLIVDSTGVHQRERPPTETIIGVVQHQRQSGLVGVERGAIFLPWNRVPGNGGTWVVQTAGDPAAAIGSVRAAVATIPIDYRSNQRMRTTDESTRLIVNDPLPMAAYVDRAMTPTRFAVLIMGGFAAVAVLLTMIGLYGVLSSSVNQRTSEIGVRMAFGADAPDILSLILGYGMKLGAIGMGLGVLLALPVTRAMKAMLVGVEPTDPLTFLVTGGLFLTVALLASWVPARRAAALDPSVALRDDH